MIFFCWVATACWYVASSLAAAADLDSPNLCDGPAN